MNRVAFRREGGLVDDLRHRRMRVDGGVDFCGGEFLVEREARLGDVDGVEQIVLIRPADSEAARRRVPRISARNDETQCDRRGSIELGRACCEG